MAMVLGQRKAIVSEREKLNKIQRREISYKEIILTTLRNRVSWQLDNCLGMYIPYSDYDRIIDKIIDGIKSLDTMDKIIDFMQFVINDEETKLMRNAQLCKAEYGM